MWDELGIAETTDLKAIRKAYASRLKGLNRTADDQAFARLHSAYQAATAWAERNPGSGSEQPASKIVFLQPAPPPAQPPVPDDEALQSLGARIETFLQTGQFQDALNAYDQGMARGILPLGDANPWLDQIMGQAVSALAPEPFVILMRRVGWDIAPWGRQVSHIRHTAAGRLEVENWFRNLEQEAAGAQKPHTIKGVSIWQRLSQALDRRAQRRNARLMLIDRPQLVRYRLRTVKDLQGKMAFYERYKAGQGSRFPERAIERTEWMLDFDAEWGTRLRRSLSWVGLLLALIGIDEIWGINAAIGAFWAVMAIFWIVAGLRYFYRQLDAFRPAWAAWLSGKGANLLGKSFYAVVVAITLFKLIGWVAGWGDPIGGGVLPWIYAALGLTAFVAKRRKKGHQ